MVFVAELACKFAIDDFARPLRRIGLSDILIHAAATAQHAKRSARLRLL
jgi:hypothetical protein